LGGRTRENYKATPRNSSQGAARGDRGAHPSVRIIEVEDADAVIEFTREYFDHVYVMPAKMGKFNFDRPKPEKKVEPKNDE
jgi:hypothetical protein